MSPLEQELAEKLSWLVANFGFELSQSTYDPRNFGESLVQLESENLRLRFTRGRDRLELELASPRSEDEWFDFRRVLQAIHGTAPDLTLNGIGPLLQENLQELTVAFGPRFPETRIELERLQQEARDTLQQRLKLIEQEFRR